ncbi:capping protein, Arp2/3 and myosin-I linker protein 3-like isoform X3 [Mobula hypostoma]|uniref:capping protein, Arp2/3 and myosin-I linker protein 3-like isoform X3 n=1 Tax=Mobula hypostoma TaxID=723540 RepID=UPI002FC34E55
MDRSGIPADVQDGIRRFFAPDRVSLRRVKLEVKTGRLEDRVMVLTRWRMCLFCLRVPVKIENSFNFLEIQNLTPLNVDQLAVETGKGSFCLCFESAHHLNQLVDHINCALSKIFPASPSLLGRDISPDSPCQTGTSETFASQTPGCCGGFSETYAALCDYNGVPCREEVQWDVDTIYHSQDSRQFNILDFSHLPSRDLALIVAALAYNQWFNKLYSRDFKLGAEVIDQVIHTMSRSLSIEELDMENTGLRGDFAQRLACALMDNPSSVLTAINLACNPLEDKGITAFSQYLSLCGRGLRFLNLSNTSLTSRGLLPLAQSLNTNEVFANTLTHLDLSKNAGLLSGEESPHLYQFLATPNVLVDLNLAGTDCALDMLFASLSHGCCSQLSSLNISQNTFTHRKCRSAPPSFKIFFSSALSLRRLNFSGTKLPAEALRALLLGLASNPLLTDLSLDLSSCELRSSGARVLEETVSRVRGLNGIDLSDNGLDSDLLTLLPTLGLCPSVRNLSLGKNCNVKSKTLEEILQTLVQVFQAEGCRIRSLSLAHSRLRSRGSLLLNALGSNACLRELDITGNGLGDLGARMLGKALQVNSSLRSISWDRNNTTAAGFLEVARALESNFTLREMPIPVSDVSHSHRTDPTHTEEAIQKIQRALLRNNRTHKFSQDRSFRLQQGIMGSSGEQMMERLCMKVNADLWVLRSCPLDSVQHDSRHAREILKDAQNSRVLFPSLYDLAQRTSCHQHLTLKLEAASVEVTQSLESELQVLLDSMVTLARDLCPLAARRAETNQKLRVVWAGLPAPGGFVRAAVLEQGGAAIHRKVSELTLLLVTSLTNALLDEILHELYQCHKTLVQHIAQVQTLREKQSPTIGGWQDALPGGREQPDNGTDDELSTSIDTLAVRRHTTHSRRIRPASTYLSVSDLEPDPLTEDETLSAQISSSTTSSLRSHSLEGLGEPPSEGAKGDAGSQGRAAAPQPLSSPVQPVPPSERLGENGAIPRLDDGPQDLGGLEPQTSGAPTATVPRRRKGRRRGLFRFMRTRRGREEEEEEEEAEAGERPSSRGSEERGAGPAEELEDAEEGEGKEAGPTPEALIQGRPIQGILLPGLAGGRGVCRELLNQTRPPCQPQKSSSSSNGSEDAGPQGSRQLRGTRPRRNEEPGTGGRLRTQDRRQITGIGRESRYQLPDPPPPPPQETKPNRAVRRDRHRQPGRGERGGQGEQPQDTGPRMDSAREWEREPGTPGAQDTDTDGLPVETEGPCGTESQPLAAEWSEKPPVGTQQRVLSPTEAEGLHVIPSMIPHETQEAKDEGRERSPPPVTSGDATEPEERGQREQLPERGESRKTPLKPQRSKRLQGDGATSTGTGRESPSPLDRAAPTELGQPRGDVCPPRPVPLKRSVLTRHRSELPACSPSLDRQSPTDNRTDSVLRPQKPPLRRKPLLPARTLPVDTSAPAGTQCASDGLGSRDETAHRRCVSGRRWPDGV